MKRYDTYKNSGIEWIGDIPEHWEVKKLGWQGAFSASGIDKKTVKGEPLVKMINYTDVYGNKNLTFKTDSNYMVVSCPETKKEVHQVSIGDLIFTPSSETIDEIGISALVVEEMLNTVYSYHVIRLRFVKDFDISFRKYLCNNNFVLNQFSRKAKGTTRKIIGRDVFKSINVVIPPKQEQTVIANYLDQKTTEIDQLINQKERLLELYEEEKTAIINQTVTKGINPKVKLKDSGVDWLGEIPVGWDTTKLKYYTNKIGDGIHTTPKYIDNSDYKFINGNNLDDGIIAFYDNTKSVSEKEYSKHKKELKKGTVLISINGTIGKLAFYNNEKVVLGKSASYIECSDEIFNEYLFYLLKTHFIVTQFNLSFSGSTINNLSLYTLNNLQIIKPEIEEQHQIVSFLKKELKLYNHKIENTKKLIALLKEYKTALISEVVTGKIKVS